MVNARDKVRQHNYETPLEVYALTNYRHLVNNNTRAFVNETVMYLIEFKIFSFLFLIILFHTFSTMCILEDRSLWILDWGAIVSNVVSMMLSGRTCLINAFSLGRPHIDFFFAHTLMTTFA